LEDARGQRQSLHSDHADYLCVMGMDVLRNQLHSKHGTLTGKHELLLQQELIGQSIPMDDNTQVTIGHHLRTAIQLFKDQSNLFLFTTIVEKNKTFGTELEMDIPGGKRHLGESSLKCAIRETLEETSLVIEQSWLLNDGKPMNGKDSDECYNAFYQVLPPPRRNDGLEEILSHTFWTNTGLST